ncbi:MAG: tripartite tricarboxylate transporter TctB family protein [Gammaproteobacteria bacterium]|nr:tripartite tricarboxylate transporter TctB family protein [Gammaproteobacteria bacterium]
MSSTRQRMDLLEKKNEKNGYPLRMHLFVALSFLVFSVLILIKVQSYPIMAKQFPEMIAILSIIFSVSETIRILLLMKKQRPEQIKYNEKENQKRKGNVTIAKWLFLFFTGYLLVLYFFGFLISTFLLVFTLMWSCGVRRKLELFGYTLGSMGIIYIIFGLFLGVYLFRGVFINYLF